MRDTPQVRHCRPPHSTMRHTPACQTKCQTTEHLLTPASQHSNNLYSRASHANSTRTASASVWHGCQHDDCKTQRPDLATIKRTLQTNPAPCHASCGRGAVAGPCSLCVCTCCLQLLSRHHLPLARHACLAASELQHLLVVRNQAGAVAHRDDGAAAVPQCLKGSNRSSTTPPTNVWYIFAALYAQITAFLHYDITKRHRYMLPA